MLAQQEHNQPNCFHSAPFSLIFAMKVYQWLLKSNLKISPTVLVKSHCHWTAAFQNPSIFPQVLFAGLEMWMLYSLRTSVYPDLDTGASCSTLSSAHHEWPLLSSQTEGTLWHDCCPIMVVCPSSFLVDLVVEGSGDGLGLENAEEEESRHMWAGGSWATSKWLVKAWAPLNSKGVSNRESPCEGAVLPGLWFR